MERLLKEMLVLVKTQNEQLTELQEIIAAKDAEIAALTAQVAALTGRIEELTHKKNSSNSSTPPSAERLDKPAPRSMRTKSGRKAGGQAGHKGIVLEDARTIHTPGVRQYPLTLECRILYAQDQDLSRIPDDIRERMYPKDVPGTHPMANRDCHTMYVGEIVDAYIIR